jgi:hypothetical protein
VIHRHTFSPWVPINPASFEINEATGKPNWATNRKFGIMWKCKCDCGTEYVIPHPKKPTRSMIKYVGEQFSRRYRANI